MTKPITNAKPTCVLFYRVHKWPFDKNDNVVKGINTWDNLSTLQRAVNNYNNHSASKFYYKLCILYNTHEEDYFSDRDSFGCDYHIFNLSDITSHGFLTNRCQEFKDTFAKLNFPERVNRFFNGQPFWFNGEYGILDYYLRVDSTCTYYWNFEADCYFNGSLYSYLQHFDNILHVDYLTSRYREKIQGEHWWPWWEIVAGFDYDCLYGSYFPLFRLSNKAVQTLIDGYLQERAVGYCEALVPTFLNYKGLSCGNLSSYNTKNKCKIFHMHRVGSPELVG